VADVSEFSLPNFSIDIKDQVALVTGTIIKVDDGQSNRQL
jgi:hypothetical protein